MSKRTDVAALLGQIVFRDFDDYCPDQLNELIDHMRAATGMLERAADAHAARHKAELERFMEEIDAQGAADLPADVHAAAVAAVTSPKGKPRHE